MKYKVGDGVTFIVGESAFTYTVYSEYLHYQKGGGNHTIFRVLGISEKEEFCKNCYGYTPNRGEFPQYEKDDYEAATRVINALQKECEKYNKAHTGSSMDNPGIVKEGDKVYFSIGKEVLEYEVYPSYLFKTSYDLNHIIFEKLQIEDKEAFCEKYYGYTPNGGDFPQYKIGDYEAAQRVIDALKKECQKHNKESIIQDLIKAKQPLTEIDTDMLVIHGSIPKQSKLIKPTSSEVVLTIKHKSYKF